ncbi:MAG TPA: helix-turn-helix domain-containing protein [Ignavibacteria bacterium]
MLKPIRNNKDYEKALERVYFLMQKELKKNSTEYAELEILSMLIEKYEDEKYPIDAPDPIEAILFRMEQLNLNKTDLAKIIGYKSRVSEILNRKRKLNLDMIRKLNTDLKIPLETLVHRY